MLALMREQADAEAFNVLLSFLHEHGYTVYDYAGLTVSELISLSNGDLHRQEKQKRK